MGQESWGNTREPITRDRVAIQGTTISASTNETTIVTATSGFYNDICSIVISNTSAATATRIDFRDATNGTVLFSINSPGNSVVGFAPTVPIPQTTKNANWTAQCSGSVTDIRILVQYFKSS